MECQIPDQRVSSLGPPPPRACAASTARLRVEHWQMSGLQKLMDLSPTFSITLSHARAIRQGMYLRRDKTVRSSTPRVWPHWPGHVRSFTYEIRLGGGPSARRATLRTWFCIPARVAAVTCGQTTRSARSAAQRVRLRRAHTRRSPPASRAHRSLPAPPSRAAVTQRRRRRPRPLPCPLRQVHRMPRRFHTMPPFRSTHPCRSMRQCRSMPRWPQS